MAQQNRSTLVDQLKSFPAGTSARTIVHTAQNIKQQRFQAYDWGEERNMIKYNSSTPPQVDLSLSTPAHALYLAAGNDYLGQPGDYTRLVEELPRVVKMMTVDWEDWCHMDFFTARDAPTLLYPHVLETMEEYA